MRLKTCNTRDQKETSMSQRLKLRLWEATLSLVVTLVAADAFAQNAVEVIAQQSTVAVDAEEILFDVRLQFSDVTVGGGFEISYDPARLEFLDFTFVDDPQMLIQMAPPAGTTDQPLVFAAGWLILTPPSGVTGENPVGTLRFRPLEEGPALVDLSASAAITPGPFYPPVAAPSPLDVNYADANITIVPEPGFGALMGCGLLVLAGLSRARKPNARAPHLG
ncbi:MAG: hypothetical protein ACPGVZ_09875 [Myxococcota bacterium]